MEMEMPMASVSKRSGSQTLLLDFRAGLVVFLVALPLCLGIALASEAPLVSGLISGIIGGIVVAAISGSHTSISGPAAGLAAIVISQVAILGSFSSFLAALMIAGALQVGLGLARAGFIGAFFPTNVIKGLLTSIGLLLILKQIPHLVGHDSDPEGNYSFVQINHKNTFSSLWNCLNEDIHWGAAAIGLMTLVLLIFGGKTRWIQKLPIPLALIVVMISVAMSHILAFLGFSLQDDHLVAVPILESLSSLDSLVVRPDFSGLMDSKLWVAAVTIAIVASLETLLNLEAVDKIDPKQRLSPPNRELVAQGIGNMLAGFLGGLPITSVIVRSSVNVNAGGQTKTAAIIHGVLLVFTIVLIGSWLNMIPLATLAAILLVTGIKLVEPKQIRQMLSSPREQALPFFVTIIAILSTDLLIGVCTGLVCSLAFILKANFMRSFRMHHERHFRATVTRLELPLQMTFLGRASLQRAFQSLPHGSHLLIDATGTETMDADIFDMIKDMRYNMAPARGVQISVRGLEKFGPMQDSCQFEELPTQELQKRLTPNEILDNLIEGNQRFCRGVRMPRPLLKQVDHTADGQYPLAVVLNCIDSRNAAELVFDTGIGELFCVRVAGNIISRKILGSIEYCVGVAGAKLIVIMGHTCCGAVNAAVNHAMGVSLPPVVEKCVHLPQVVDSIIRGTGLNHSLGDVPKLTETIFDEMARLNMLHSLREIYQESPIVAELVTAGNVLLVGAMYDVATGMVTFLDSKEEILKEGPTQYSWDKKPDVAEEVTLSHSTPPTENPNPVLNLSS